VRAPTSRWVCEPCVYFCARLSPVPGRPPGKCSACKGSGRHERAGCKHCKRGKPHDTTGACLKCEGSGANALGGNFRNVSHLYDESAPVPYVNASKGEKPAHIDFLRAPHAGVWFAAIAESGQKHVLPWAPVNPPGSRGRVLFDEQTIALPDAAGWRIVDDLIALLTAGATKEEIERGDYGPHAWSRCEARIRAFEADWGDRLRGGDWFALALWLAQRDEDAVTERRAAEDAAKAEKKARAKATAKTAKPAQAAKPPATKPPARPRGTRAPRSKTTSAAKTRAPKRETTTCDT